MRRLIAVCTAMVAAFVTFAGMRMDRTLADVNPARFIVTPPDPPGCALDPGVTFCNQILGTTSQPLKYTIQFGIAVTNPTVSLAAIPGFQSRFAQGDFTITANTCTGSFTPGQECMLTFTFSPTTIGLRESALMFHGVELVALAGTGATLVMIPPSPPSCVPQDDAFTYCTEDIGAVSGTQPFTLTTANAVTGLQVAFAPTTGLSTEFNAADFTIESTTCTGALAANTNCTINVAFTPTSAGLREATLTATDSNGDIAAVYLAGHTTTALVLAHAPTSATCSLADFEFCNEPIGGTTASRVFTLTNTSGVQITGLSVPATSAMNNFKLVSTSCVSTLAAGENCTINVAFTPQTTGFLQDAFNITDNQGDIGTAAFAGTGDDYELRLASGQATELTVVQGDSITYNAQVVSDSVFGLNGEQAALQCPANLPPFTSCTITPCPGPAMANSTTNYMVVFATSSSTILAHVPGASTPPGCTGYGVSPSSALAIPRGVERPSYHARSILARALLFPALATLAMIALMRVWGCVPAGYRWMPAPGRLAIRPFLVTLALAIGLVVALSGCHHGSSSSTMSGTPLGQTNMQIQGVAFDSQGDPLNATRGLPMITIDVVAAQ